MDLKNDSHLVTAQKQQANAQTALSSHRSLSVVVTILIAIVFLLTCSCGSLILFYSVLGNSNDKSPLDFLSPTPFTPSSTTSPSPIDDVSYTNGLVKPPLSKKF